MNRHSLLLSSGFAAFAVSIAVAATPNTPAAQVTATASTPTPSPPNELGPNPISSQMAAWAKRHGDAQLADAVHYNLAHVQLLSPDKRTHETAEKELARIGDEFTLAWMERHLDPSSAQPSAAIASRLKSAITRRLAQEKDSASQPPDNLTRMWLLRGAISDVTCNAIETPLKTWSRDWVRQRLSKPEIQKELSAIAKTELDPKSRDGFAPLAVQRSIEYARSLLGSAPQK